MAVGDLENNSRVLGRLPLASSSQDKMSRILRKDQVGSNDREFCLQKFGLGKVGGDRPETMHVKASSSLPIKQESGGRNIDPSFFFYNVIDKIYTPPPPYTYLLSH